MSYQTDYTRQNLGLAAVVALVLGAAAMAEPDDARASSTIEPGAEQAAVLEIEAGASTGQ